MIELKAAIQALALDYWNESGDEELESFPLSIVDFVIEYAINQCHFPKSFTDAEILATMDKFKSSLAMACIDIYSKAGAEGEKSHSENGIARTYSDSYIDTNLLDKLPNYVTVI